MTCTLSAVYPSQQRSAATAYRHLLINRYVDHFGCHTCIEARLPDIRHGKVKEKPDKPDKRLNAHPILTSNLPLSIPGVIPRSYYYPPLRMAT